MELPDNIINCPGVLAALAGPAGTHHPYTIGHGEPALHGMLKGAMLLMLETDAGFVRVVARDRTFVAQREGGVVIVVAFKTGDPIAKSLHRMIRRGAKQIAADFFDKAVAAPAA